jgi:outer membrane protein OmpA-like peptidoglycan-associated protein
VSRSPERPRRAGFAAALAAGLALASTPAWAQPAPPPADAAGQVLDVVGEVVSLDGAERQSRAGATVTVTLAGDVLFEFDKSDLTPRARERLRRIAEQISSSAAGGIIRVAGHTDDQGSDSYNDDLSRGRAGSVKAALGELLGAGRPIEAVGHGEREPKVPNVVDGQPSEENRARNRRVEIIFDAR